MSINFEHAIPVIVDPHYGHPLTAQQHIDLRYAKIGVNGIRQCLAERGVIPRSAQVKVWKSCTFRPKPTTNHLHVVECWFMAEGPEALEDGGRPGVTWTKYGIPREEKITGSYKDWVCTFKRSPEVEEFAVKGELTFYHLENKSSTFRMHLHVHYNQQYEQFADPGSRNRYTNLEVAELANLTWNFEDEGYEGSIGHRVIRGGYKAGYARYLQAAKCAAVAYRTSGHL